MAAPSASDEEAEEDTDLLITRRWANHAGGYFVCRAITTAPAASLTTTLRWPCAPASAKTAANPPKHTTGCSTAITATATAGPHKETRATCLTLFWAG